MKGKREYRYRIGSKLYVQRPLVLGQIGQVAEILQDIEIPKDVGAVDIIALFGKKLSSVLAVVLTPEGVSPKDKDIEALAEELETNMTPEDAVEVIEDFLDCNHISSILERLNRIAHRMEKRDNTSQPG